MFKKSSKLQQKTTKANTATCINNMPQKRNIVTENLNFEDLEDHQYQKLFRIDTPKFAVS